MIYINSRTMRSYTENDIQVLKFKALDEFYHINHAVSTRSGGVSSEKGLSSLNLGTHTNDTIENVRENYKRFCAAAGFNAERIVLGNQTHSANIRYATEADMGKGVFLERDYTDVDALVTDCRNLPLVIHTADCVPISFIDIKGRAIGNAHCGWRGTFSRLATLTAKELFSRFGVAPDDLFCTIGPCICKNCYEVSKALYDDFINEFGNSQCFINKNGKFYIDLAGLNKELLIEYGVREDNIVVSDICTCENSHLLYSHRAQGAERGIFASFLELL